MVICYNMVEQDNVLSGYVAWYSGTRQGMVWCNKTRYGYVAWYGIVEQDEVWYGYMAWYGIVEQDEGDDHFVRSFSFTEHNA